MRSTALPAILLLVGILLGIGISQLLNGGSAATPPALAAGVPGVPTQALTSAAPGQPLAAPQGAPAVEAVRAPSTAMRGPSETEVERVARSVARTAAGPAVGSAGDGSVQGRVLDEAGQPVAGVVVRLEGGPAYGGWSSAADLGPTSSGLSAEAEIARDVHGRLTDRATRRESVSRDDGSYAIDGLPDGVWRIEAFASGAFVRRVGGGGSSTATGARVDFVVTPAVPVTFEIVHASGEPVDAAVLEIRSQESVSSREVIVQWTREQPTLPLATGSHTVQAYVDPLVYSRGREPDAATAESEAVSFLAMGSGPDAPVQIVVEPSDVIYGVVSIAGERVPDNRPRVALVAIAEDTNIDELEFGRDLRPESTSSAGQYAFNERAPGRYALMVSTDWSTPASWREVIDYTGGILRRDVLVELDGGDERTLRVTALGPDGSPLGGVRFSAGTETDGRVRTVRGTEETFRGGAYAVDLPADLPLPGEAEAGTSIWVQAIQSEYGSVRHVLAPGEAELTLRFDEPALVVATVGQLENRDPGSTLYVSVRSSDQTVNLANESATVDAAGVAEVEAVPPGLYRVALHLRAGNDWRGTRTLESFELDLSPGQNSVRFDLPRVYSLTVRVPEDLSTSRLTLTSLGGGEDQGQARTERVRSSVATFAHVQPGPYELRDRSDPPRVMQVSVPTGEILFEGRSATAAIVRIDDGAGRLAQIGLADGDRILGIGSVDYGSPGSAATLNSALGARSGTHVLRVSRNGSTSEMSYDAGQLSTTNWGGAVAPVAD